MNNIQELKPLLAIPKDVVITTHRNPDGDAIGSSLGLRYFLEKMGHSVHLICPSDYPVALNWMEGLEDMVICDEDPDRAAELVQRAELIFCLDFNSLDRIDKLGEMVAATKTDTVMIDHHLYPEPFAEYFLSDTSASSTCELIYDFILAMDGRPMLDVRIGNCLFTGILTDTGSFKYGTSAKLYRTVADLIDLGVEDHLVQDLVFNSLEEKHLRLLGHCLSKRMEILPEYHTGIITLTKEDYNRFDIQRGDTEGIVNYLLKIKDVVLAAFITEQPTIVKLSLRSKGDISVQEIARKYFKGGGHKNAAGGASFKSLHSTVRRFKKLLPEYREQLAP